MDASAVTIRTRRLMEKDGTERGTSCTCTHRVRFVRANDGGVFPSAFIGVLKSKPLYGGAAMTCEVAVQFPDGTSRLCLEHKCRPSAALKLVTCTRLCPMRATGGLPSLMMRLRQVCIAFLPEKERTFN